jgi:Fe-S oxidoreductase
LLGRKLQVYDAPRALIEKMGGVLVKLGREKDEAPCCGAGGAFAEVSPELSQKIAQDRIEEVIDCGAEVLVTACEMCTRQFRSALATNHSLEIFTLTELLLSD